MKEKEIHFYMDVAKRAAEMSYAERKKVGAVVVTKQRGMYIGFNGTPAGFSNCCEHNGVTLPEVIHAEKNALGKMLREGVSAEGSTVFVTLSPCTSCASLMIAAGVDLVVYEEDYRDDTGKLILGIGGVKVQKYERDNLVH